MTTMQTAGKVETLAKAAAAEMNAADDNAPGWTAVEHDGVWDVRASSAPDADGVTLDTYDAFRLTFRRQWNRPERVTISAAGVYGLRRFDEASRQYVGPSPYLTDDERGATKDIGCAIDTDPARVAKRVAKLAAAYLPILRERVEYQRQAERDLAKHTETAERIVRLYGGYVRGSDYRSVTIYPDVELIDSIELSGNTARVTLRNVPADKLGSLLAWAEATARKTD